MTPTLIADDRYKDHVIKTINLLYSDHDTTPAIAKLLLDSRSVAFDRDITTLTTEGTTETFKTNSVDALRFTVDQSVMQYALERIAMPYTTGITGEAGRSWYTGEFTTDYFGLEVTHTAVDIDNGALVTFVTTVPKVQISDYNPFQGGSPRKAVTPEQVILEAIKTATNLLGAAIPMVGTPVGQTTVPSGGVYFYRAKLA